MTHKAQHIILYRGLVSLLFLTYIAKPILPKSGNVD